MQSFEAFVAQRYLHTRKKGAFVRVMVRFARWGIALGVFGLVVTLALMNGFQYQIQANLFSATSHFQVFHEFGDIPDTDQVLSKIREVPGVVAASPTRTEQGLLRSTRGDAPPEALLVRAVDPFSAHKTAQIFDSVQPGRVEDLKPGEIIVGAEMMRSMGLKLGNDVAITFMRSDLGLAGFQPRMMAFKLVGAFETHISEYDKRWSFIHLDDAKSLAGTEQAEYIDVRARDIDAIEKVKPAVLKALNGGRLSPYGASDLREINKPLFAALKVEKWIFGAILSLLVLIAAFNIVATLVLLVTEKRRDLGVLLAQGATPKQVQRLFVLQGIRIGALGTAWGLGISVPFCLIADRYKLIKLPSAAYDFITYVPFRLSIFDLIIVAIFPLVVAWWASRYPARRASNLDPVDALRAD